MYKEVATPRNNLCSASILRRRRCVIQSLVGRVMRRAHPPRVLARVVDRHRTLKVHTQRNSLFELTLTCNKSLTCPGTLVAVEDRYGLAATTAATAAAAAGPPAPDGPAPASTENCV